MRGPTTADTDSGMLLFTEALVLPTQGGGVWSCARGRPERALAAAVLHQAGEDLRKYRFAQTRYDQRIYWQAYDWVASSNQEWPYSFLNICDALCLSPEAIRTGLLREPRCEARAEAA